MSRKQTGKFAPSTHLSAISSSLCEAPLPFARRLTARMRASRQSLSGFDPRGRVLFAAKMAPNVLCDLTFPRLFSGAFLRILQRNGPCRAGSSANGPTHEVDQAALPTRHYMVANCPPEIWPNFSGTYTQRMGMRRSAMGPKKPDTPLSRPPPIGAKCLGANHQSSTEPLRTPYSAAPPHW